MDIENMSWEELKDLKHQISTKLSQMDKEKRQKINDSHKSYVGKCYKIQHKDTVTYFRVISVNSTTEDHLEVLRFNYPVMPRRKYLCRDDELRSCLQCDFMSLASMKFFDTSPFSEYQPYEDFEEISVGEFFSALNQLTRSIEDACMAHRWEEL